MKKILTPYVSFLELISVPAGVFGALYFSLNLWAGFVMGAILVILVSTNFLNGILDYREDVEISGDSLAGMLFMYSILFVVIFAPLAIYVQQYYEIEFMSKQTHNYYTSYEN